VLICHCLAVHERHVRDAVSGGACTVEDVIAVCGAGGRCGGCRPLVADVLAEVGVDLRARDTAAA
jgi:bacterioferritin-associated ferredoxin